MRRNLILVEPLPRGGEVAARLVDGRLEDLLVDPPPDDPAPRPGAIHRAILGRPLKGLGGAIVDLGGGARGFLRDTRGLAPGRPVLVQVAGWAEARKAPPVTRRLILKGRLAILTPGAPGINVSRSLAADERPRLEAAARRAMEGAPDGVGLVLRSAAAEAEAEEVAAEIAALRRRLAALDPSGVPGCLIAAAGAAEEAVRDWPDPGAEGILRGQGVFDAHGLWEEIAALRQPFVPLAGGASMAIEPSRAFISVDVDTGEDLSPAAGLKANLAAMRELPRQLRLRGLGGIVMIDLAPLARRERQRVLDALKAALARDGIATTVAGFTPLGALELSRRRDRRPLAQLLPVGAEPLPVPERRR
jgi:ribonuclease G